VSSAFVPSPPRDLAIPSAGSQTARVTYSMAPRKLFDDLKALRLTDLSPDVDADYRLLCETLVSFLPDRPGAIASLLRSPSVAAPLRRLRDGLFDGEARETLVRELVHQSFFQLSLQGALDEEIPLRSNAPARMSPFCRAWRPPEDHATPRIQHRDCPRNPGALQGQRGR